MIGHTLGRYRILEKLGSGGMGEVYRARDEQLKRAVAVKVLLPDTLTDEGARRRFRKEAQALSRLNHPHIAQIYDFGSQEDLDFLVMEEVPGESLKEKIAKGPVPEKELLRLGGQIADALQEAHDRGIVHRDLKPGNVKLTARGQAKVLDFGLAKILWPESETTAHTLTETRGFAGTIPYMAPEQLRGESVDARSDIYSLGVMLYEMAVGQHPFKDDLFRGSINAILRDPPPAPHSLNPEVSASLEHIILKCLEKDAAWRYQSAMELRVDLERLQAGRARAAAPAAATPAPLPAARPRRWGKWAVGAAVALLAALVALSFGSLRDRFLPGLAPPARINSLAVLPLENLSGNPEEEYFAEGMTESLITNLSKIRALKVVSGTSVLRLKNTTRPVPEIARELDVDAFVEGSVFRAHNRVRITAQLIDAATDRHLWADSYERDLRDVFSLQREVARAITEKIRVRLDPQEERQGAGLHTVEPEALDAYLKGRYLWNRRSKGGLDQSLDYFNQAIEKDPNFALAYVGSADAYAVMGAWHFMPPQEAFARARAAATRALELDNSLAEAYASLAVIQFDFSRDAVQAETNFRRSLELNPGYATAHQWYAEMLSRLGRHQEAIAEIRRAQQFDPLSLIINSAAGYVYFYAGRYDEAERQCRRTIEIDPSFSPAHLYLSWVLGEKGKHQEAIAEVQEAQRLRGNPGHEDELAFAYARAGQLARAREILSDLLKRPKSSDYGVAYIYAALGEKDKALTRLWQAHLRRDYGVSYIRVDPKLDSLRADPRFQELLRRMNFPG